MPKKWSDKRERQYQHVRESELDRGRPVDRAEEIAAATVNKTRAHKSETKDDDDSVGRRLPATQARYSPGGIRANVIADKLQGRIFWASA